MALENKVAIVTGGSNGIGLAIVTSFVASGAKVAVLDIRTNDTFASQTNIHFINTNITSEDNVNSAIAEVVAKFGRVDILVNNAGQADNFAKTADTPSDTWAKIFAVNVTGAFHLIKACIPIFQKQESKGCIINICSIASIRGSAAGAAYTMSKHALLGLSRSTSWGYRDEGIRCNAVVPGGVQTGLVEHSGGMAQINPAGYAALASFMKTMPGACKPEDVAAVVLFLTSANAVNGAEISVDHGWQMA